MNGLCQCGCGELAPISQKTCAYHGWVKGMPKSFINGHQCRSRNPGHTVDPETGCWNWNGFIFKEGYPGYMAHNGHPVRAHRAYYEKHKGPILEGMTLDHLCRNRRCVNPDHLEPVTIAVNCRRGTGTKLTTEGVAEIILSAEKGEKHGGIAQRHGVSRSMVGAIVTGKRWTAV